MTTYEVYTDIKIFR